MAPISSVDVEENTEGLLNEYLTMGRPTFDNWKKAIRNNKKRIRKQSYKEGEQYDNTTRATVSRSKRDVTLLILGILAFASLIMAVINQAQIQPLETKINDLQYITKNLAAASHKKDTMIAETVLANKQTINLLFHTSASLQSATKIGNLLKERSRLDSSTMYGFNSEINSLANSIIKDRYPHESRLVKRMLKHKIKENCIIQNMLNYG